MAEALLASVADRLVGFTLGRVRSCREISDDIVWLRGELSMMQALFRDADRRSATDEAFKEWLEQVTNVAFKIEDFLDYYGYRENLSKSHPAPHGASFQLPGRIANLFSISRRSTESFIDTGNTADEIASIKKEVECISKRAQTYGLHRTRDVGESSMSSDTQHRFSFSPLVEDVEMVGFDADVRLLMDWLLIEDENIPWSFMCIVGMGGSGKTALAKRVYTLAHNHFDHHLWVNASKYCRVNDLLKAIEKTFKQSQSSNLGGNRYVLVIDDFSFCTPGDISRLSTLFNGTGKIILTSRQNITASLVNENLNVHKIKPLPRELAWDLFRNKAFRFFSPPGTCPEYLIDVATEIVRRCSGLPLAIVLMGGLMSTKGNSPREWRNVLDRFSQELLHNPHLESISRIFQTSFYYLPSHLQYCFLYSCLFPKGSEIKRKKIIRLWVAQGFVEEQQGKPLEEVADDYFIQLIEGSMLEPIISSFTGELVSYRVHDIMYEMALSNFKDGFGLFDKAQLSRTIQKRYLAIHEEANVTFSGKEHMKARALLVFKKFNFTIVLPSLIFLRVLCLDGTWICQLPDQVVDLCYLTYLGLRGTLIRDLPHSLGKLHNLETLDVRDTEVRILPPGIANMRKLRHLLLRNMKIHSLHRLVSIPDGISDFCLLQTLSGVKVSAHLLFQLRNLEVKQLKKLYVSVTREDREVLFDLINRMVNLSSLKIECRDAIGKYAELSLGTLPPLPEYLEKLTLGGHITKLPPWFARFNSLRVLQLVNSKLAYDPLRNLSNIPNLVSLSLFHAYIGREMGCGEGGFPKLRHLRITNLDRLEEWTPIELGTMPCIQVLSIIDCSELRMLPQGFEQLITLQTLELIAMPQEFIRRLTMEDFYKVQHISKVTDLPGTNVKLASAESTQIDKRPLRLETPRSSSGRASSSSPFVEATRKRKLGIDQINLL